jgi:uncharacterized protein YndB with AHSA1/START domain
MEATRPIGPIELTAITTADPATAWRALTDPEMVALWFTEASDVGPVGAPYRLDFGDGSVIEGVIREVEPGHRLSYSWVWAGQEPRQETLVTWTSEPDPRGGTRIALVHAGWAEAGADEVTRDDHTTYWEMYLDDLVTLLDAEDGPGGDRGGGGPAVQAAWEAWVATHPVR